MQKLTIVMLAQVALLASAGCGDDTGGAGGGSGGAGGAGATSTGSTTGSTTAASTTSGTTANSSSSAGGGGGGVDCTGAFEFESPECQTCSESLCCTELADCAGDPDCTECVTTGDEAACTAAGATAEDLGTCLDTLCAAECAPVLPDPVCEGLPALEDRPSGGTCIAIDGASVLCNPVTNEGCATEDLFACDVNETGDGFQCFGPPNGSALCAECPGAGDNYCAPGLTCIERCYAYCCDDSDCGGGTCDFELQGLGVGVCVE